MMQRIAASILMSAAMLLSGCSETLVSNSETADITPTAIQTELSDSLETTPVPTGEQSPKGLIPPESKDTTVPQRESPAVATKEQPKISKEETSTTPKPKPMETSVQQIEIPEAPEDADLVRVKDYIPSIFVNLKYASNDNFTGEIIYDFTEPLLRYGTVKKLAAVQAALLDQGYSLMIWDAYRPTSAQFKLWEICPDATYVANPNKGASSHSRGNTIDVTLVRSDGSCLEMPTGFDDFTIRADRDYSDVSSEAAKNALLLEQTMVSHGFQCYSAEWWHYSDVDSYSVIQE